MGDRGNIVIRDSWPSDLGDKEAVFLYTHWGGTELPTTLQEALSEAEERWSDPSYLARVIFQKMVGGDDGVTGYGISTRLTDNEYDLLVLHNRRVYMMKETRYNEEGFSTLAAVQSCSFAEYVDFDAPTWGNLAEYFASVIA